MMSDRWPFSKVGFLVLVIALAGGVANFVRPGLGIAFTVNMLCLFVLCALALRYFKEDVPGFDPIVAAEGIIAFGVFSLIAGLVSVVSRFIFGVADFDAIRDGRLNDFFPFVEGLLTAGIAPFVAILLRFRMAEVATVVDPTGDLSDLARATAELTKQMNTARAAIDRFGTGAEEAGKSTVGLASAMKTEADRWGHALMEGEAHIKSFATAAKGGASDFTELAVETLRLKAAASDVSTLLEELARLIESVERFVAPRAKA